MHGTINKTCRKCRREGRLFELALKEGYDCPAFIEAFMNSRAAAALDDVYDRLQWAGEEYIQEELNGLSDAATINDCWMGFHTLDAEMAIDDLKEMCKKRQ